MNPEKNIVILTPGFAESEQDSTTIPALQVYLRSLKKSNPQLHISIISFQFPFSTKKYKWHGITVFPLNGKNNKLKKPAVFLKAWSKLQTINKETPVDLIHSFWIGECSFLGERFARKHGLKHLVTAMGQDVLKPNIYAKLLSQKNTKIVTLSKRQHDLLLDNYNLNSDIIPWGIDTSDFPVIGERTIDILGVGSFNSVKNYSLFIALVKKLRIHPLKVELIGEGNLRPAIENEIKKYGLSQIITLTGALSRGEVLEKMSRSRILLHTSNYESFGYVFAEALYSGMKVISFNVGIAQESAQWKVCNDENDAVIKINEALSTQEKTSRILLTDIENTVQNNLRIYNE